MITEKLKAIIEVSESPKFKSEGFTVDIRDDCTIVLRSGQEITNDFMHKLSKRDSESILKIITMSLKNQ